MSDLTEAQRTWWLRPEDERDVEDPVAHEKIKAVIRTLQDRDQRKRAMLLYGAIYTGTSPGFGSSWSVDAHVRSTGGGAGGDVSLNVSRSVVDAVTSRVFSKAKPHLTYATEGGGPDKQHNAEMLEKGVDGVFYQTDFYAKATQAGTDGCVYGLGPLRIEPDWDERVVGVQRWDPWNLLVDDGEAVIPKMLSLYSTYYEDRYRLASLVRAGILADGDESELAAKAALVDRLEATTDDDAEYGYQQIIHRVLVREAWRKPTLKGGSDGRYVVGVDNVTLIDRAWDGEGGWPFESYSWSPPLKGFYGQGLIELGLGTQGEINKLVRQIQEGHHYITGHWLVEMNSRVITAHLQNDLRNILKYAGTQPPTYVAPAIIAPEVYTHLWNLVARYYMIAGVNEQSAAAQKPAGLDSGEAQRVYADQQTETLLDKGARFEAFVKNCGARVTRAAKELAGAGVYEVRSLTKDGYDTINWKDLDDPDGYELQVSASSSLPGTLAGKMAYAQDLLKLGVANSDDLAELSGRPDLEKMVHLKLASRRLVQKKVGEMLRDGTPWAPTPFLNVDEAIPLATALLNDAEFRDVDDGRLQVVRDFIANLQDMKKLAAPPPAPQAMAPGAPGLMAPGAPDPVGGAPAAPHLPTVPQDAAAE